MSLRVELPLHLLPSKDQVLSPFLCAKTRASNLISWLYYIFILICTFVERIGASVRGSIFWKCQENPPGRSNVQESNLVLNQADMTRKVQLDRLAPLQPPNPERFKKTYPLRPNHTLPESVRNCWCTRDLSAPRCYRCLDTLEAEEKGAEAAKLARQKKRSDVSKPETILVHHDRTAQDPRGTIVSEYYVEHGRRGRSVTKVTTKITVQTWEYSANY